MIYVLNTVVILIGNSIGGLLMKFAYHFETTRQGRYDG